MNFALRPLSTSEILDRTFGLYRNHFLLFAGIAILPALIAFALDVIGVTAQLTVRTPGRSAAQAQLMSYGYSLIVFFISSVIGGGIATGATLFAVYDLYLKKHASISASYRSVLARWFRVITAGVLVFLLVLLASAIITFTLGYALFRVIPSLERDPEPWLAGSFAVVILVVAVTCWIYLSGWFSFVIPAVLLDKNGVFGSFRRSHRLSRGSRGRIFLVLLLTFFLTLIFSWTLRVPGYMIFNRWTQEVPLQLWIATGGFLSTVLAGPVATVAIALFYIDQRIRKEAFDLQLMIQSIQESDIATVARMS